MSARHPSTSLRGAPGGGRHRRPAGSRAWSPASSSVAVASLGGAPRRCSSTADCRPTPADAGCAARRRTRDRARRADADPGYGERTRRCARQQRRGARALRWVDRDAGIAAIPIERAMDLVVVPGRRQGAPMNDLLRALLDLPPQASTFATQVDLLHFFVIATTMLGAAFVFFLALYFVVRDRRDARRADSADDARPRRASSSLIGGLLTLFLGFWIVGDDQYDRIMTPPPDAMPVYVTAKQWMWKFAYADGRAVDGRAHRPGGPTGQARDDVARRHPQLLRARVPDEAGRRSRAATTRRGSRRRTPGDVSHPRAPSTAASATRRCSARFASSSAARLRARGSSGPDAGPRATSTRPRRAVGVARRGARRGCLNCHTIDGQPHIGPTWVGPLRLDGAPAATGAPSSPTTRT